MYLNSSMESISSSTSIMLFSSISLLAMVSALAVCSCCKRRKPKSELIGVEGTVKLKHLDDSNLTVSIDTTDSTDVLNAKTRLTQKNATLPLDAKLNGFQENELKRSSANAPHRSLPDIPINEIVCDNNSELYATVGDKLQDKAQSKSPLNKKKLSNISQHSSMSQADDVSSPYARVRSPAHAYDKLKKTEHPYAQVVQPATAGGVAQVVIENDDDEEIDDEDEATIENPISHRESSSNHDLLSTGASIDASAAISGRISASQELPYMTPPIAAPIMPSTSQQHQHFSGDSQDSSKGYTSISVREPLANIIAQTNQQNQQRRRREIQDSHYATLSDDTDEEETYAAIEEPNNLGGDLYTSGSETYAQIIQAPITVAVEINTTAPQPQQSAVTQSTQTGSRFNRVNSNNYGVASSDEQANSNADVLKNLHSRQASSSSCTSSVGNIGSPKPEKRQANSPLPPTPKGQHSSNPSRNSTSSILEYHEGAKIKDSNNNSNKVKQSPSKDLEGMYAKVMKKNKLSSVPSENSSPILNRHEQTTTVEFHVQSEGTFKPGNEYETIDKKRNRSRNNEASAMNEISDAGYETIPADRNNNKESNENSTSFPLANEGEEKSASKARVELFKDQDQDSISDPKYETLKLADKKPKDADSDYDPNYETILNKNQENRASSSSSSTLVDDNYAQIGKKLKDSSDDESIPGYSTIKKPYSSINDEPQHKLPANRDSDTESNIYSSIPAVQTSIMTPSSDSNSSELLDLDYKTSATSSLATPTTTINNYESLSTEDSTTVDESNYESMKYLKENPYERLDNEKSISPDPSSVSPITETKIVEDYFKV